MRNAIRLDTFCSGNFLLPYNFFLLPYNFFLPENKIKTTRAMLPGCGSRMPPPSCNTARIQTGNRLFAEIFCAKLVSHFRRIVQIDVYAIFSSRYADIVG